MRDAGSWTATKSELFQPVYKQVRKICSENVPLNPPSFFIPLSPGTPLTAEPGGMMMIQALPRSLDPFFGKSDWDRERPDQMSLECVCHFTSCSSRCRKRGPAISLPHMCLPSGQCSWEAAAELGCEWSTDLQRGLQKDLRELLGQELGSCSVPWPVCPLCGTWDGRRLCPLTPKSFSVSQQTFQRQSRFPINITRGPCMGLDTEVQPQTFRF